MDLLHRKSLQAHIRGIRKERYGLLRMLGLNVSEAYCLRDWQQYAVRKYVKEKHLEERPTVMARLEALWKGAYKIHREAALMDKAFSRTVQR